MPFTGSGTFIRLYSWVSDKASGIKISATRMDAELDGFATGLSNCITRDGQTTILADLPMNNRKIVNLANPTAGTDAMNRQTADALYWQMANLVVIGQVAHFALPFPPTGWLKANGAAVSRTTYAGLFGAIGTTFGAGDGATTFNLPDLRGEFIRGWDDARGVDSGRVFGTAQADDFKSHTHTVSDVASAGSTGTDNYAVTGTPTKTARTSGAAGGTETRPRNIALLACIKY